MNAAAAAGKALSAMTRLRPNLSDKEPRQSEPHMLATLRRLMIQPASSRLRFLVVRNKVGVHAATLQKTEPPTNSATARARIEKDSADRKSTRLNSSHQLKSYAVFCL